MSPRLRSLHNSAETFAHIRGLRGDDGEPLTALDGAQALGASGIEGPVWLTSEGVAVVSADGSIGPRLRRRALRTLTLDQLPASIPSLDQLCRRPGPALSLLLDVTDDRVAQAVLEQVRAVDPGLEAGLWLCSPDIDTLVRWRADTTAKLVNLIRPASLDTSAEQRVARLASLSIDALGAPHNEWTAGLVALAHRFERLTVARGAEHERELAAVLDIGLDAVSSPQVERMMAVAALYYPSRYRAG